MIIAMAYMAVSGGRFSSPADWFISTLLMLPGIMIALSFHEFAHAAVAYKLGDDTPKFQKRVTINPMAHLDPIGLICLIFIGFGWGKPVMVNPSNFKSPRRDELLVSLAGVTMNLLLAFVFGAILGLCVKFAPAFSMGAVGGIVMEIIVVTIRINIVLMIFNLIPVPPLDGFNVISSILDIKHTELYYKIYQNGMIILLLLIIFDIVDIIFKYTVMPLFYFIINLFL
jgi:Zn-dependent protease